LSKEPYATNIALFSKLSTDMDQTNYAVINVSFGLGHPIDL